MRTSVLVLSVLALVVPGVVVTADGATAGTPAQVVDVTADPGPFSVAGFAGQAQSVISVLVDDPSGTIGKHCMDWYYAGIRVRLVSGVDVDVPAAAVEIDVPRVSSVAGRDTYSAPWRIASTRTGTWTITRLDWCGNNLESIDPRTTLGVTRTITVSGTAAPVASVVYVPRALPYPTARNGSATARQSAVFTYRTGSGMPIPGATVTVGTEYACWFSPIPSTRGNSAWPTQTLRTSASGQVVVPLIDLVPCVSLMGPPAVAADAFTRALVRLDRPTRRYYYLRVAAVPSARYVRVGRTLTVLGQAVPATGSVRLQRLVGRTWRTVATARVRPSARFTLAVPVARAGRAYYRVIALSPWSSTAYVSYTLVATPTRPLRSGRRALTIERLGVRRA